MAFVCIEHLEGRLRPLFQERRRPKRAMPERLRNAKPAVNDITFDGTPTQFTLYELLPQMSEFPGDTLALTFTAQ